MMCKFCQSVDNAVGRNGKLVHINRDGLCAPCATLLNKVKYQPDKVSEADQQFFDRQCLLNHQRGMFVPVAQRKILKATNPLPWRCKACGTMHVADRDFSYTNYCVKCADEIRRNRVMPAKTARKRRSDYGQIGSHHSSVRDGIMTKVDRRVKK